MSSNNTFYIKNTYLDSELNYTGVTTRVPILQPIPATQSSRPAKPSATKPARPAEPSATKPACSLSFLPASFPIHSVGHNVEELYPNIKDDLFQHKLANKYEFRNLFNPEGLYEHQEFVRRFLSPYTPYRCLLLYHSLGSGKSFACIAVAVDHYIHSKKLCIVVTKGSSGRLNFVEQICKYRKMSSNNNLWNESIFDMKHYIALSNQVNCLSDKDIIEVYSNKTIVLDEVHNVSCSTHVYNALKRVISIAQNIVLIMCTATPMTDNPDEINAIMGLCNRETRIGKENINFNGIVSYNNIIHTKPEAIYMGKDYKGIKLNISEMISTQKECFLDEHKNQPKKDIYISMTHISLFCTPQGEYGNTLISKYMNKFVKHKSINTEVDIKYTKYVANNSLIPYLSGEKLRICSAKYSKLIEILQQNSHTINIKPKVQKLSDLHVTDDNFRSVFENDDNIESIFENDDIMLHVSDNACTSIVRSQITVTEKAFIFVENVVGSGILLLANILEQHGYDLYVGENLQSLKPGKRYTLCVGSLDICPNMHDRLNGFNSPENNDGRYVQILLGSKVISESITLMSVRQFHCITPHWNNSLFDQAMGRVVRTGTHVYQDKEKQNVRIYIHAATAVENGKQYSIDLDKIDISLEKQEKIKYVEELLIANSIEAKCKDKNIIPEDFRTFAAVYSDYYLEEFKNKIKSTIYLENDKTIASPALNIEKLSELTNSNILVCKEIVTKLVMQNVPINKNLYIRVYDNIVFFVSDPSIPFITIPPPYVQLIQSAKSPMSTVEELDLRKYETMTPNEILESFRYMPVMSKVEFVERCILNRKHDLLTSSIPTIFIRYSYNPPTEHSVGSINKGTYSNNISIYHFLLYRNLEKSYTSSCLNLKHLDGKTKKFDGYKWYNVTDIDEETEVARYYAYCCTKFIHKIPYRTSISEAKSNSQMRGIPYIDFTYIPLGIISTIDGKMRLCKQNDIKNMKDKRYIMRGKSISSIKKDDLFCICQELSIPFEETMSINKLSKVIDKTLIERYQYIIV